MMSAIRILLAEDHVVVREATVEVLNHQPDMKVVGQAGNGEEAVTLARDLQPDVVIMDVAMPRLNGLAATRQILTECPHCRVLVLTAHEEEEYIVSLLQAGVAGYLPKTVGLADLLAAVRAVARGESVLPPSVAAVVMRRLAGRPTEPRIESLTERELEVLRLAAQGATNYDIAQRLYISVRTVEAHLTHIYVKLRVASRTEAVVYAMRQGWISPG
jgi:DNA-binding NarL/FixJ family response regulator